MAESSPSSNHRELTDWVERVARTTRPQEVVWCDGSEAERDRLTERMRAEGSLIELDPGRWPGCWLHRSHPTDVARVEHLTYICTPDRQEAGPTNHWMSPKETHEKVGGLFKGCMKGRTMYVVPYLMGPVGSPFSKFGVEVTDSPYVVLSMRIMTRMGRQALDHLGEADEIVYGQHSIGELDPERRFICHLPQERLILSYGSGYGGNALLGKKCFALRLASVMGREQGWMAEHMLIVGVEDPEGEVTYLAAAFPSACGKTNLAMLVPPASQRGWRVWTVGDDIAWIRPGPDGRLWAINPESGFFGVLPGTSEETNPNAMASLRRNAIFTNTALTPDGSPWWEGLGPPPRQAMDWQGRHWTPGRGVKAAHPNSRFTAPASQCPSISPQWEAAQGVPISAFIFGGRRARVAPLVYQALDLEHGVYVGATMASETTAAAAGKVGVTRRDPMAMLPFCGYHMADYWSHWLAMAERGIRFPAIFHVNWFRMNAQGEYLWPGFGENLRVLRWIIGRVKGRAAATESPIGFLPTPGAIDREGLNVPREAWKELLAVDRETWQEELTEHAAFFSRFGRRLPLALRRQHEALNARLNGD